MTDKKYDYSTPQKVSRIDIAFPARGGDPELLPPWEDIPKEFQRQQGFWCHLAQTLFMGRPEGLEYIEPKKGIDLETAASHIKVVLGSFASKHEHKIAGAGYLFSLWFDQRETPLPRNEESHEGEESTPPSESSSEEGDQKRP